MMRLFVYTSLLLLGSFVALGFVRKHQLYPEIEAYLDRAAVQIVQRLEPAVDESKEPAPPDNSGTQEQVQDQEQEQEQAQTVAEPPQAASAGQGGTDAALAEAESPGSTDGGGEAPDTGARPLPPAPSEEEVDQRLFDLIHSLRRQIQEMSHPASDQASA